MRLLSCFLICWALVLPLVGQPAAGEPESDEDQNLADEEWPRKVEIAGKTYGVYPVQLDSWDGFLLSGHAAFMIEGQEEENPTFGVVWISAQTTTDKDSRLVTLDQMTATRVRIPSAPEEESDLLNSIQERLLEKTRVLPLDNLEAELAVLEAEKKAETFPLKNDPPEIVFSDSPSILVYIDGSPAYRPTEVSGLERIINTNVLLVKAPSNWLYLHLFDGWLEAPNLKGPWRVSNQVPEGLEKVEAWARETGRVDLMEGASESEESEERPTLSKGEVPRIFAVTELTELIVTDGAPEFENLPETKLSYVSNTTGHVFKHSGDGGYYLLVSGRWFYSAKLEGPWRFIKGGQLPPDFAAIPDDSPKENVKASVPGTPQAQEAVIAASVPQTASVKFSEAKLTPPIFDGEPQLAEVEGTSLEYVVNSPTPILKADGSFYAVENGVWFVSGSLEGPWQAARSVPPQIYSIPPSEPLHYVTYVKIYRVTEDSVVVGYTPGYNGTVVTTGSGAIVVYGTGYYYRPWVGAYWFGPPVTYGAGVSITYTPWTGWCFGFGFGWYWGPGYATVGWGWGPYPWWGPVGWGRYYPYPYYARYGYARGPRGAVGWGPGGWAATTGNVYHRWGPTTAVTRQSGGYNAWTGNRWARDVGMSYNSRTGNIAAGQRAAVGNVYTGNYAYGRGGAVRNVDSGVTARGGQVTVGNARTGNSATAGRVIVTDPNTGRQGSIGAISGEQGSALRVGDKVYAGKDGNVYRRGDSGWEQVERSGNWGQVQNQNQIQSLDRSQRSRTQGSQRYQNYRSGSYRSSGGGAAARPRPRRR